MATLPQPQRPEKGSRKVVEGREFFTTHNFTTELGNIWRTVDGSFILPNGEPAKNRTILELLPNEFKGEAISWWEKNYGAAIVTESAESGKQMSQDALLQVIADLQKQVAVLTARSNAEMPTPDEKEPIAPQRNVRRPGRPAGKGKATEIIEALH